MMKLYVGLFSHTNTPLIKPQTFAKEDLPKEHRVVNDDSMMTMDHNPKRMNVHTDDDGTVRDVKFG